MGLGPRLETVDVEISSEVRCPERGYVILARDRCIAYQTDCRCGEDTPCTHEKPAQLEKRLKVFSPRPKCAAGCGARCGSGQTARYFEALALKEEERREKARRQYAKEHDRNGRARQAKHRPRTGRVGGPPKGSHWTWRDF